MTKNLIVTMLFLSFIVILTACGGDNISDDNEYQTDNMRQLVNDYSAGNIKGDSASITSTELIVIDSNDKETSFDISEEEFFVSIAPFISETHPCIDHSLTGCQGEMVNKNFDVHIEDMDGNIVIDKTMNSGSNGFIDLWLPRDQSYRVLFSFDEKQVESEISTFKEDQTCITTMQLL